MLLLLMCYEWDINQNRTFMKIHDLKWIISAMQWGVFCNNKDIVSNLHAVLAQTSKIIGLNKTFNLSRSMTINQTL